MRIFPLVLLSTLMACGTPIAPIDYSPFVWPKPPSDPKIKLIKHIATDLDIRNLAASERMFGLDITFFFGKTHGIAADNNGNIYVSDNVKNNVYVINTEKGSINNLFLPSGWKVPMHIAVDNEAGIIAVADAAGVVSVFGLNNHNLRFNFGKSVLKRPVGVAICYEKNRIFVSDSRQHGIFAFSLKGEFISKIVQSGFAEGYVYYPSAIATDSECNIYVVDTMNFRFQAFDFEGTFINSFGEHGDKPGMFARPKGISVSDDGLIFVTDAAFGNFQIFDKEGRVYLFVGHTGKGLGEFTIPQGIFVDHNDKIYVADSINARVQIFQYLSDRYLEAHPEEKPGFVEEDASSEKAPAAPVSFEKRGLPDEEAAPSLQEPVFQETVSDESPQEKETEEPAEE